jgi:hypothetical protein
VDANSLRARVRRAWPCARDLVFTYRAGERDPRDFEAALPEIEVSPIAHAIFAKLAPGRALSAQAPVEGHTYDWGEDAACVTAEGDGILLADYAVRDRSRDDGPSRTVHHVLVRDDACVMLETGSTAQRVAQPRVVVQLSATADALDAVTDAVLELAPAFGLAFVERLDAPVRVVRGRRPSPAVRAFERVLACSANATAQEFAWIVIGMVPAWFDFAADKFEVQPSESVDLIWKRGQRSARVQLSSSRNIFCTATDGGTTVDEGKMSMHYTPSTEQYDDARRVLLCALRWLFDAVDELPADVLARIPAGRVFPR